MNGDLFTQISVYAYNPLRKLQMLFNGKTNASEIYNEEASKIFAAQFK